MPPEIMEDKLRKLSFFAAICTVLLMVSAAHAQRFDVAFGASTVMAKGTTGSLVTGDLAQTIGGGTFLNFGGTLLLKKNFGFGGEVAWRAKQNLYGGYQPFRPIFYDFNGVYAPMIGKHAGVDLMAGIGAETARFYTPTFTCGFTGCTNYVSQTHFMGHFGGGVRLYVSGHFFVRPEAHLYLVHNNVLSSSSNLPFSSNYATRVGVSIGYSLGGAEE